MVDRLSVLRHEEPVELDPTRLQALCRRRGPDAEAQIADMLARLDAAVQLCEWEFAQREPTGLARAVADVHELAGELGMVTLERAAVAVLDSMARRDPVALAACAARLFRLGESCERSDWSLDAHPPATDPPA